jgi:hypothetical protein
LTLDGVRGVLEGQLHPCNLELNVAGDFEEEELEALVLNFMGKLFLQLPFFNYFFKGNGVQLRVGMVQRGCCKDGGVSQRFGAICIKFGRAGTQ